MSIDPDRLMAYVDGELDEAQRREVERAMAADPALRDEVDRQHRLRATLITHYGPVTQEDVPDRLRALLGAAANAAFGETNVASLAEARERRRGWPVWANAGAIAASLAIGIIGGQILSLGRPAPISSNRSGLVAQGDLARALETQLGSSQPAMAPTRIGLTFVDTRGRACRTFEEQAFAGLACREEGRWQIVMTSAGETAEQPLYRQAGSSPVTEAAQRIMASEPFDAAAERAAVQGGWKIGKR